MRRLSLLALGVASALALAGALSQFGFGGSKKVQIGNGHVSALTRSTRPSDALPARILALPFAAHNFASAAGAGSRLARVDGTTNVYLVPGKGSSLCLVEVDAAAGTSGGACADRSILLTGSIYMADLEEDGTRDVVGLVGDGHTYAEANGIRVPTTSNVFVLRGIRGDRVALGSATATQTLDVGE